MVASKVIKWFEVSKYGLNVYLVPLNIKNDCFKLFLMDSGLEGRTSYLWAWLVIFNFSLQSVSICDNLIILLRILLYMASFI